MEIPYRSQQMTNYIINDAQREAVNRLRSGNILCGDVGSGKSRTALAYYFEKECGGSFEPLYSPMRKPKNLYIITTAKKRDSLEWDKEMSLFHLSRNRELCDVDIVVDSWNNITKYSDVTNSFFIFDEQRLVGSGTWVKAFYKITGSGRYSNRETGNNWILLSATPGDKWSDYIPVFVANKFYKTKSEFLQLHAVYNRYSKFPRIDKYVGEKRLKRLRASLLVDIRVVKKAKRHYQKIPVQHNSIIFRTVMKDRWNVYDNKPIENSSELYALMRRVVNSDPDRIEHTKKLIERHKRVIIFYNFDYELEMLRCMCEEINIPYSEWNGKKHQKIQDGEEWVYLVHYNCGEAWNCIDTNAIIFYSLNYSYRTTMQAAGRIDRMNTTYMDLYYYFLKSDAWIDRSIMHCLNNKKDFNESAYIL